jgi:hypothetical protein
VANGKPNQRIFSGGFRLGCDVRDVRIHLDLDGCEKPVEHVAVAFGHELDSAVGKVANKPCNLETPSERLSRETKPDPLNATRVIDSATITRHEFRSRLSGGLDSSDSSAASNQTFTTFHTTS